MVKPKPVSCLQVSCLIGPVGDHWTAETSLPGFRPQALTRQATVLKLIRGAYPTLWMAYLKETLDGWDRYPQVPDPAWDVLPPAIQLVGSFTFRLHRDVALSIGTGS